MRLVFILAVMSLLTSCSVMTTGEFDWLDESERIHWSSVSLSVIGRNIQFEIPDKSSGIGQHTQIHSFVDNQDMDSTFDFPKAWETDRFSRIVTFFWDRAWGGFYKQSEWDFSLDISVELIEKDGDRLGLSSDERIQLEIKEKQEVYVGSTGWPSEKWFFERWWIKPYNSEFSTGWIVQNMPQVAGFIENFKIPITSAHDLQFSFFLREERMGGPATEEWLKKRRAIIRQIMETVTIDPPPYPVEIPISQ